MRSALLVVVGFGLAAFAPAAPLRADEPLPAKITYTIRPAHSKACYAEISVEDDRITLYRQTRAGKQVAWRVPGYRRIAALSDDCQDLMTGDDGGNLLRSDDPAQILLRFYRDGELVREVRLDELMDPRRLTRTASHYAWGNYLGVEGGRYYRIEANGRGEQLFDMSTGKSVPTGKKRKR